MSERMRGACVMRYNKSTYTTTTITTTTTTTVYGRIVRHKSAVSSVRISRLARFAAIRHYTIRYNIIYLRALKS